MLKLVSQPVRSFAAINASHINLDHINPKDIQISEPRAIGAVLHALANSKDKKPELCNEIEEFFRIRFRKMNYEESRDIIKGMGYPFEDMDTRTIGKIEGLDDKFWIWETLEEATRPHIDSLDKEELFQFMSGWSINL